MHRLAKSSVLSFILILPQLSLASQKKSYSRALQNLGTLVLIAQNLTYASHEDRTCEHDGTFNEAKGYCDCYPGYEGDYCQSSR